MKAKITKEYECLPNGHLPTQVFPVDAIVEGQIAAWAIADGHAVALPTPKKKGN